MGRLIPVHSPSSPPLIRTNGDWVHIDLDVSVLDCAAQPTHAGKLHLILRIPSSTSWQRYCQYSVCVLYRSPYAISPAPQISPSAAELIFLISAFFLLRPPVTSSLIFGMQNTLSNLESIVTQALHARVFGRHLMNFVYHLLGIQQDLLDFAGRCGRTSCGLGDELEDDIELESQMHANTPPSYEYSHNDIGGCSGLFFRAPTQLSPAHSHQR
ncbi:uncharacterized protein LACBIDRAFT_331963 [Laccaria bicolor S238N-H82]|uniref:Predicted protein n=1 Tax=Laccaria bicolor (strain S238N-H82 / ATCC MYA-4686) TaxID=486041 RepID=B0DR60_LACBS|nr:uncharacterized protein LACBIDRAFT_331963 [Laccaria bicolor S238N-H82]EDR03006.1 predicted protein [Laccaria bicolor S238N-H82]|eukprot:XP_001886429.1 predicted protein [Laccaria bicolor S238N-H82]